MQAGRTSMQVFTLNGISTADCNDVTFTFVCGKSRVTKHLAECTVSGSTIYVPLKQEDTAILAGKYTVEIQADLKDGSVPAIRAVQGFCTGAKNIRIVDGNHPNTNTEDQDDFYTVTQENEVTWVYKGQISTKETENGYEITVSDPVNGTKTLQIKNGTDGAPGTPGEPGAPGAPGEKGDPGNTPTIQVGTITTLPPGQPATVQNVGTEDAAVFDFGIPEGEQGSPGAPGNKGDPGTAATIQVGTVTTLDPGQTATVQNAGTENEAIFNFGIPKGATGAAGPSGYKKITAITVSAANQASQYTLVNGNLNNYFEIAFRIFVPASRDDTIFIAINQTSSYAWSNYINTSIFAANSRYIAGEIHLFDSIAYVDNAAGNTWSNSVGVFGSGRLAIEPNPGYGYWNAILNSGAVFPIGTIFELWGIPKYV